MTCFMFPNFCFLLVFLFCRGFDCEFRQMEVVSKKVGGRRYLIANYNDN